MTDEKRDVISIRVLSFFFIIIFCKVCKVTRDISSFQSFVRGDESMLSILIERQSGTCLENLVEDGFLSKSLLDK